MRARSPHQRRLLSSIVLAWTLAGVSGTRADLPVEVLPGECPWCDAFPVSTNAQGQVIHRMTSYLTSGGSLPRGFKVPDKADGNQEESGAYRVSLITVQHAYAASFDLDLAPKIVVGASNPIPNFHTDTFDEPPFIGPNFLLYSDARNVSDGFRVEDYNYTVSPEEWPTGALVGYDCDDQNYHAPGEAPGLRDYDFNCAKSPTPNEIDAFAATARFMMTCNVGPNLLTGIANPANIVAYGEQLPARVEEVMVVASNGANLKLITGPLAPYWGGFKAAPTLTWIRQADSILVTYSDGTLEFSESMEPGTWSAIQQPSPAKIEAGSPKLFVRVRQ